MKFTRTLASVAAAAVAVSSLAVSAFAAWDGANKDGNVILNVADILPEGVDINDVYGVRINFTIKFVSSQSDKFSTSYAL